MLQTWLWYLPLATLAFASVALIFAGTLAWGAAEVAGYADWLPTFAGVVIGTVCLVSALLGATHLRRRLSRPYHARGVPITLGLVAIVLLIFITTTTTLVIGDSGRYQGYDADEGRRYTSTTSGGNKRGLAMDRLPVS